MGSLFWTSMLFNRYSNYFSKDHTHFQGNSLQKNNNCQLYLMAIFSCFTKKNRACIKLCCTFYKEYESWILWTIECARLYPEPFILSYNLYYKSIMLALYPDGLSYFLVLYKHLLIVSSPKWLGIFFFCISYFYSSSILHADFLHFGLQLVSTWIFFKIIFCILSFPLQECDFLHNILSDSLSPLHRLVLPFSRVGCQKSLWLDGTAPHIYSYALMLLIFYSNPFF